MPGLTGAESRLFARVRVGAAVATAAALGCSSASSTQDRICSQAGSGLETCPSTSVVHGIDVSTYQGVITWSRVKEAGVAFAFARISDGTTVSDTQFASNWKAMKVAGVLRGPYQYFRASEDPVAQAGLVGKSLNGAGGLLPGDLPVVMDIETADGQSNATVQAEMAVWLEAVARATGRAPIIYTNPATSSVIGSRFANYALWVANWGQICPTMPSGWSTWRFWQYSDTGSVSGVPAMVDLDEFDGALRDLLAFAAGDPVDAGGPDGADVVDAGVADASHPTEPCMFR
jgi:lysozyme